MKIILGVRIEGGGLFATRTRLVRAPKQFAIGRGPPVLPTVAALAGVHSFATKPQALGSINASICSVLKDHAELRGRVCCWVVNTVTR